MSHPTWQVFGTFDEPINAYKGMQMGHVMVQDYYQPDPRTATRAAIVLHLLHDDADHLRQPERRRSTARSSSEFLHDYAYTAAWWAHAEGLPDRDATP